MEIIIREENENDYRKVEEITREAFWNLYIPGAEEHYLVNQLRKSKYFIKELDLVALYKNEIIANIMYTHSKIIGEKEYSAITFGPVCVKPEYQKLGVGKQLIKYSMEKAKELGHNIVVIFGDKDYYKKYGFTGGYNYKISDCEGRYPKAMLVLSLTENALEGVSGKYFDCEEFHQIDKKEVEKFDKTFKPKEKFETESQKKFLIAVSEFYE